MCSRHCSNKPTPVHEPWPHDHSVLWPEFQQTLTWILARPWFFSPIFIFGPNLSPWTTLVPCLTGVCKTGLVISFNVLATAGDLALLMIRYFGEGKVSISLYWPLAGFTRLQIVKGSEIDHAASFIPFISDLYLQWEDCEWTPSAQPGGPVFICRRAGRQGNAQCQSG